MEDIVQTSITTGPRGALRLAQGIQAFLGVGSEWLADVSNVSSLLLFNSHAHPASSFYKIVISLWDFLFLLPPNPISFTIFLNMLDTPYRDNQWLTPFNKFFNFNQFRRRCCTCTYAFLQNNNYTRIFIIYEFHS